MCNIDSGNFPCSSPCYTENTAPSTGPLLEFQKYSHFKVLTQGIIKTSFSSESTKINNSSE